MTKYIPLVISVLVGLLSLSGLYIWHQWGRIDALNSKIDVAEANVKACNDQQEITKDVSNDYQSKIASLNSQLANLKRLRDNPHCLPVVPATGRDAGAGSGKSTRQNGISREWLLDYAGEAEKYRLQLIACQIYIDRASR